VQAADLPKDAEAARIVCVSDTHERHKLIDVPAGDVLIHTGDMLTINRHFSESFSITKLQSVAEWMHQQPHPTKIIIAGNHDHAVEHFGKERIREVFSGCTYLEDDGTAAEGLRVWGSPYSRGTSKNTAFQSAPRERLAKMRAGLDILLTHGPLPRAVLGQLQPRLHVCGHIHGRYGVSVLNHEETNALDGNGKTMCVNASIMDGKYHPTHSPVVIDVPR
jgi:Icc-related predicted phosphoesterase